MCRNPTRNQSTWSLTRLQSLLSVLFLSPSHLPLPVNLIHILFSLDLFLPLSTFPSLSISLTITIFLSYPPVSFSPSPLLFLSPYPPSPPFPFPNLPCSLSPYLHLSFSPLFHSILVQSFLNPGTMSLIWVCPFPACLPPSHVSFFFQCWFFGRCVTKEPHLPLSLPYSFSTSKQTPSSPTPICSFSYPPMTHWAFFDNTTF